MSKRQLEDTGFANVLRQKFKEDESIKRSVAQKTFERLMNAQRRPTEDMTLETQKACYRCSFLRDCDFCKLCERSFCKDCRQQCIICESDHCTTCSVIDYSESMDRVFCLPCTKQ